MATIVTRAGKGSPLTNTEVDNNFTNLNTDKLEKSGGTMTGDLSFGDNDKAIFGAGSDLQIYHDGTKSVIDEVGTGNLYIKATELVIRSATNEDFIDCTTNGAVRLYHDNSAKLATTSTGIDVTGTVTADGLVSSAASEIFSNGFSGGETPALRLTNTSQGVGTTATLELIAGSADSASNTRKVVIENTSTTGSGSTLQFYTTPDGTNLYRRLNLHNNGDISFYEDTGTTAKFFWDASTERLGIGTSSPSNLLHLSSDTPIPLKLERTSDADSYISYKNTTDEWTAGLDTSEGFVISNSSSISTNQRLVIDSSGNVGIGVSSPSGVLHSYGSNDGGDLVSAIFHNQGGANTSTTVRLGTDLVGSGSRGTYIKAINTGAGSPHDLAFGTNSASSTPTERMRIDSSGNLLVSATTTSGFQSSSSESGTIVYAAGGIASNSPSNDVAGVFNRLGTDGIIVQLKKDGTTVGSIGSSTGYLRLGSDFVSQTHLIMGSNYVAPATNSGATNDGNIFLGSSSRRFKDLYLSGGVYLGGTGAANYLDDYEEGTFTPTATASSGAFTTTSNTGTYRKVGSMVYVHISIGIANVGTGSGYINLSGLPFAFATSGGAGQVPLIVRETNVLGDLFGGFLGNTPTDGRIHGFANSTTTVNPQTGDRFNISACYITS